MSYIRYNAYVTLNKREEVNMKCNHPYLVQTDEVIGDYSHPMRCEDCNEVIECPHYEIDYEDFSMPTCVDCLAYGEDVVTYPEYDKYEHIREEV